MAKWCPSCGYGPVGPFIDNCPICAEPVRNVRSGGRGSGGGGMSPVLRWLGIGAIVAVLAVGGCCGLGMWRMGEAMKDAQQQMEQARAEAEAKRPERTVAVPAAQLLQEFQDDPAAADRKYKGKYLEVSGVVERSGVDGNHAHFVILHGGDEKAKLRIECFFFPEDEVEEGRIERLDRGQTVTVSGEFAGRVTNIQLRECKLAK